MNAPARKKKYVPAVSPGLAKLLALVFALFSLLFVNSVYLVAVRLLGWFSGQSYENWYYLIMFLIHLVLGFAILVPVVIFGILHIRNAHDRPNRRAVRVGYALFGTSLLLLISGVVLTRIEGVLVVNDAAVRAVAYWTHVTTPLLAMWLFVLHRLAGKRIQWKVGMRWAAVGLVFAGGMLLLHAQDPRDWNQVGNPEGDKYFFPSLARTTTGEFIPAEVLHNDDYCLKCHEDSHAAWSKSAHRFSSFNNPAYLASVKETREFSMELDGNVNRSRWCAGCHDPVPFFSGSFSDPKYDMVDHPTAKAGITCTVCHSITHVNSKLGNADFTIDEPVHYPFATSDNPLLSWVNEQLIKAKPEFHKKTFLKPLHQSTEFCGSCHKVHLPPELNDYKWLRGQNHYDAFLLSGVAGSAVASFYYPPVAEENCNKCHMPLDDSEEFGSKMRDGRLTTMNHQFPSANTAVPVFGVEQGLLSQVDAEDAIRRHREFNEGVMRVDLFALHDEARIDAPIAAPLRPEVPALEPGKSYLLDAVIRTVKMGHIFTQGTVDSNEVWLEMTAVHDGEVVGKNGGMDPATGTVDPWSHFVNVFLLDREGQRINRRNAQDIFTPLYNHQIPPGAADVVHYRFTVPEDATGSIEVKVRLRYRKFDREYMSIVREDPNHVNDLPILELAEDTVVFPIAGSADELAAAESKIPTWQRWNDYGIGLLRKGGQGELRQAEAAFAEVEELGRPEGPVNLARVYLREGRVTEEAPAALRRAQSFEPPAHEWWVLYFGGLVAKQNGQLDQAIENFRQVHEGGFAGAQGKKFDFTRDFNFLTEYGTTLYERARQERGEARREQRDAYLEEARTVFEETLFRDPENLTAHYNLALIWGDLGDEAKADEHRALHARYKPDDNAQDHAIAQARIRYPAANHAAEAVTIYDLQRPGAFELPESSAPEEE